MRRSRFRMAARTGRGGRYRKFVRVTTSDGLTSKLPVSRTDRISSGIEPQVLNGPGHHDPKVVAKAEAVFAEMGMTPQEAVSLFYKQTALRGDFPITEWYPNEETQAAILEARAGIGLVKYNSVDEMMAEFDNAGTHPLDEI